MSEIDRVMAVMEDAFDPHWGEAWTRQQLANSLAMPHTYAIVIDSAGRIGPANSSCPHTAHAAAGFVLARRVPGEEELMLIAVRQGLRRHGLGRRLLDAFLTSARRGGAGGVFLEMRANNPAQDLYLSLGFEPIGRRPDYYRLGNGARIDAITFGKTL